MSPQNEPIKPAAFELEDQQPAPTAGSSTPEARGPSNWVLPTLAGLVVLALIVVFWLPGRFDGEVASAPADETSTSAETAQPTAAPTKSPAATEEATPWSDAQLAKLRKEAQDILAILLDVQFELQEMGIEQWAGERFEAAKALAAQGDLQYRDRQFVEAKASYEQALSEMESLTQSAPQALHQQLELARQAIEGGDQSSAIAALEIAALIEPGNTELATLHHRAETLVQLLPLLTQAQDAEQSGDLANAETLLQQATTVDPLHQRAGAELARVKSAHTLQRFNRAMSAGYSALDDGQFSKARTAFRDAGKLSPGSAEVSGAQQDLEAAETAWRLTSLQNSGQKQEQTEQWQQAVQTFEKALAIDSSLVFAQQGLKRSKSRAQLDKQFNAAIDKPERLSDKSVAQATARLLRQAATISPRGPVLANQLTTLEILLEQAGAQIQLTLRSDGQTEVTLRRVSRLGQFKEKALTLRPGSYTVIGSRNGYRDVRRSFTLNHDSVTFDVEVICTEKI